MKRKGTFHQLYYHFVWSTLHRAPLITPSMEAQLLSYLERKCKELDYRLLAANGTEDHFHVLAELTPVQLVADFAKNLKGASSHFINHLSGLRETLYWQDGYGVVTLRKEEVPKVIRYIQNQKQHHREGNLSTILEQMEPND